MPEQPKDPTAGGLASSLTRHPAPPESPVLYWKDGEATRAELETAAGTLARRLGAVEGTPVACVVDAGADAVIAMFATWLAGGVYVPVNARLSDAEIRDHILAARPAAVIADAAQADRVPPHIDRLDRHAGGTWAEHPATAGWEGERLPEEDPAIVVRTSGTTGAAKAVVLGHAGVAEGIDTVIAKLRGGKDRRGGDRAAMPNLIPTSMALWAGIWNLLFAFRAGAPAVLLDRFDPVDFAALVKRFEIRSTILAPAMMTMLAEDPRVTDLSPLKLVRSVTAPLTPAQALRFRDRFGAAILNSYGQTELGGEVVGWTAADTRDFGDAKLGAAGRPHPGVTVRILDEDSAQVPPGEVGEVWVRSSFASPEGQVEAGRLVDGFLRTGDLGRLDGDGFLWIEGRVSDMVNRGGMKVVPQEVEEVLRRHPDVADVCVAGVPDERLGEVPVAWVCPAAGADPEAAALLAFARKSLAGYKVPAAVRFVADLPRTEIGKVRRGELVAGYEPLETDPSDDDAVPPDGTDSA